MWIQQCPPSSGDSRPDLWGASREQHDYCCMAIEFQGALGVQPPGFLHFEGLKTALNLC